MDFKGHRQQYMKMQQVGLDNWLLPLELLVGCMMMYLELLVNIILNQNSDFLNFDCL